MSEQLRAARQRLTMSDPVPDLEDFVENHLRVDLDQYFELPDEVLGVTEFNGGAAPRIKINAALTEAAETEPPRPGMRGRWRATIAHEASHVILHRYLFDPAMAPIRHGAFRDPANAEGRVGDLKRMACLHRDIDVSHSVPSKTARDWREVQANKGMAALLMPGSIFKRAALMNGVTAESPAAGTGKAAMLVAAMAEKFDVSKQAAAFRLREFGLLAPQTE